MYGQFSYFFYQSELIILHLKTLKNIYEFLIIVPKFLQVYSQTAAADNQKMSDYIPLSRSLAGTEFSSPELKPPKLHVRLGSPLVLPQGYGCVVMTGLASVLLLAWKSMNVTSARTIFEVPNPLTYSDKSMTFNCVHRALQSTVEIYPQFLFMLLIGGLEMPYFCSVGGLVWILGRFIYARGYYSGDPTKRANGSFFIIGQIMLGIGALKFGLKRVLT